MQTSGQAPVPETKASVLSGEASHPVKLGYPSSTSPLVSIDAARLAPGPLKNWPNAGTLGGGFISGLAAPRAEKVAGRAAVTFTGKDDFLRSTFAVPQSLSGRRPFTVTAWAFDPGLTGKKTIVSWAAGTEHSAEFGTGRGRNAAFFSSHRQKIGYEGGVPEKDRWQHLAVTFDGSNLRVYRNGLPNARREAELDVRPGEAAFIGAGWNNARKTPFASFIGSIASLEIYGTALSLEEIWKLSGGTGRPPVSPPPSPYALGEAVRPDLSAPRDAGDEATFFISSDLHFGTSVSVAKAVAGTIDGMNGLPGKKFPAGVGGGVVPTPRGIVLLGDLIDDGNAPDAPAVWAEYESAFGLNGEGRAAFPVFEGVGNHDGDPKNAVRSGITARNRRRPGVARLSSDGLHASWDWGGVHFVHLNLFPGSAGDDIVNPWGQKFQGEWKLPRYSLEFLKDDLARSIGRSGRPVVLFQHYGWDEWSRGWWSAGERAAFRKALEGVNVLGVFWGHSHSVQRINGEGLRTWCVGAGQRDPEPGEFFVVRITPGEMIVAERRPGGWGYAEKVNLK